MTPGERSGSKGSTMAISPMAELIHQLRRTVLLPDGAGLTDGQLLEDYISRRDEAALAALVQRHGPMVWGVCRRVLATTTTPRTPFRPRSSSSSARRRRSCRGRWSPTGSTGWPTRRRCKAQGDRRTRRRGGKGRWWTMPEPSRGGADRGHDLQPLLDEELSRLPDNYRAVIVLCDLEGKTRKEAARQLGVPEGTVAGRLARARAMLAKRLTQRGVALSGGALAAVLSQQRGVGVRAGRGGGVHDQGRKPAGGRAGGGRRSRQGRRPHRRSGESHVVSQTQGRGRRRAGAGFVATGATALYLPHGGGAGRQAACCGETCARNRRDRRRKPSPHGARKSVACKRAWASVPARSGPTATAKRSRWSSEFAMSATRM